MGKKSRRKAKKSERTSTTPSMQALSPAAFSLSSAVVSKTTESSFSHPFPNEPKPKNGWARALREAERELRHNPANPDVIVRTAKLARVMRQFERLGNIIDGAESKCVTIVGPDNQALLRRWREECSSHRSRRTRATDPQIQSLFSNIMREDTNVDSTRFDHPTFSNLSALQYAAFQGDVQLLERLVGLGAALDCSDDGIGANASGRNDPMTVKKPPGSTALLLSVLSAMCSRECLAVDHDEAKWREMYEGAVECAIQLVRLGANVDVRLRLPTGRDAIAETYEMMKAMKWDGKTSRELAPETGSELLVQTMQLFSSNENKIKLVNCRCGSRMPWNICHSAKKSDCHYKEQTIDGQEKTKLIWRFSPLAPCPCKNTTKIYFKCCWEEPFREYFQDDETAVLQSSVSHPVTADNREYMMRMAQRNLEGLSISDLMGDMNPDDVLKMQCCYIRMAGQSFLRKLSLSFHPKSKIGTWDPNVYAGVMECMNVNDFFQWNDIHWTIPKPELLKRVAEWNKALEKYCDGVCLAGSEREEVIKLHTASPFAPCANLSCEKIEKNVKEFSRCSRCLSVAYCSRACSREDYPFHKTRCVKR